MCGITGIYNLDGRPVDAELLRRMTNTLVHRGPDDEGYLFLSDRTGAYLQPSSETWPPPSHTYNLGFGHRRLSIIDLSPSGHQPMSNDDGTIWITYNGEIYNYLELRAELRERGHRFLGQSDTEVILRAYEEYGPDCLNLFNGMWGFVLWDGVRRQLFCARDRFGVKPFYYVLVNDQFLFASEIKALLSHPLVSRRPNEQAIFNYLSDGFGFTDMSHGTFFNDVQQLEPGHTLIMKDGRITKSCYWTLPVGREPLRKSQEEWAEEFRFLLEEAVRLRLRSDVPVGVFLSGGLDSSSIACLARQLSEDAEVSTFSVYFDDPRYDERQFSGAVVESGRFKHHQISPSAEDFWTEWPRLVWVQEEPFANLNIYAQWKLMQLVKERGVVVVLNGHGGDELLNGYEKEWTFFYADLFRTGQWSALYGELGWSETRLGVSRSKALLDAMGLVLRSKCPPSWKRVWRRWGGRSPGFLSKEFANGRVRSFHPDVRLRALMDRSTVMNYTVAPLPGWLHSEDRASMAFSLESRSPFLDCRLVDWASHCPPDQKFSGGWSKGVLRRAMKGVLPEKVRLRVDKRGFPSPTGDWLRGPLRRHIDAILRSPSFRERGFLNASRVQELWHSHCRGNVNAHFMIWSWVNLELWFRVFVDHGGLDAPASVQGAEVITN